MQMQQAAHCSEAYAEIFIQRASHKLHHTSLIITTTLINITIKQLNLFSRRAAQPKRATELLIRQLKLSIVHMLPEIHSSVTPVTLIEQTFCRSDDWLVRSGMPSSLEGECFDASVFYMERNNNEY